MTTRHFCNKIFAPVKTTTLNCTHKRPMDRKRRPEVSSLLDLVINSMDRGREGYFPPVWKAAEVILVPKPRSIQTDLRPVSLLPGLAKIFESIVCVTILLSFYTHWLKAGIISPTFTMLEKPVLNCTRLQFCLSLNSPY